MLSANVAEPDGRQREGSRPRIPPADAELSELRAWAFQNNLGLRADFERWQAALEEVPRAKSYPEPRLTYTEFLREVETRVGPQERRVGLRQEFPWFGTLGLKGQVAETRAAVRLEEFRIRQLALDAELRQAFAEFYYLGQSIVVTRETLLLLQKTEKVVLQRLSVGAQRHLDVVRLQVEMGRLEDRLTTLLDSRSAVESKLRAILDFPYGHSLDFPVDLPAVELDRHVEDLRREVVERNPEVRILDLGVKQAALHKKLAESEYYPDFSIGVETIVTSSAVTSGTRGSGDDPWSVTLGVDLPLWRGKYRAGERKADREQRSVESRKQERVQRLWADLDFSLYRFRDAQRRLLLHENTLVPKAEEALLTTEAGFRAGTASFLDLMDSERTLLDFKLARARALADRLQAKAETDRILGRLFSEEPRTVGSPGGGALDP